MRVVISIFVAVFLLAGGIVCIVYGNRYKEFDCSDPRNQCTGYDSDRTANCATHPDVCRNPTCTGCLYYELDYSRAECLLPKCDVKALSVAGVALIVSGAFMIIGAVLIIFLACWCCRPPKN